MDRLQTNRAPYGHVVNTSFRNGTVIDINRQVPSEIRIPGVECDVTRHGHVETGHGRDGALGC